MSAKGKRADLSYKGGKAPTSVGLRELRGLDGPTTTPCCVFSPTSARTSRLTNVTHHNDLKNSNAGLRNNKIRRSSRDILPEICITLPPRDYSEYNLPSDQLPYRTRAEYSADFSPILGIFCLCSAQANQQV